MDILGLLKELFSGVLYLFTAEGLKTLVMFVIAGVLIYLAIKKDYEPDAAFAHRLRRDPGQSAAR